MKSSVKAIVVVVLVTELGLYVSQQLVCDDVYQQSPQCSSSNTTETHCRGGLTESRLPLYVTVCSLHSTSVCIDPCPCSPDNRSVKRLQYRLDHWLCSWKDVTLPLPLLLLVVDMAMCYQHSCALPTLFQLLLSLLVLVSNARLQAMLVLVLEWATHRTVTVPPLTTFPDIYLALLVTNLLFRLLLWRSHCSYKDTDFCGPRTSLQPPDLFASVTDRLQYLSIGPSQPIRDSSSWLSRVKQLDLLSSPAHTQPQPYTCPSPSTLTVRAASPQQRLLWPPRLQPPRTSIISATASLSLSD